VNNTYQWSSSGTAPDGDLFTDFLARLNNDAATGTAAVGGGPTTVCLAGHCAWRIPNIVELKTILNCSFSACIDPVFGPADPLLHWSSTTDSIFATEAWDVFFNGGFVRPDLKTVPVGHVRAVRAGR
jgi:hypothetical protein